MAAAKTLTPEQRQARSRLGAAVRTERTRAVKRIATAVLGASVDELPTDALTSWAEQLAAAAPPLTAAQIDGLRPLLTSAEVSR